MTTLYGAAGARSRTEWIRAAKVASISIPVMYGGWLLGWPYSWYSFEIAAMMGIEASLRGNPNRVLSAHGTVVFVFPCLFECMAAPLIHCATQGIPGSALLLYVLPTVMRSIFGDPLGTAPWLAFSLHGIGTVVRYGGLAITAMFVVRCPSFHHGFCRVRVSIIGLRQCAVPVFRLNFALEDAIGSHACLLEANMRVCDQWHSSRKSTALLPLPP
jgi:hypothetical protein